MAVQDLSYQFLCVLHDTPHLQTVVSRRDLTTKYSTSTLQHKGLHNQHVTVVHDVIQSHGGGRGFDVASPLSVSLDNM